MSYKMPFVQEASNTTSVSSGTMILILMVLVKARRLQANGLKTKAGLVSEPNKKVKKKRGSHEVVGGGRTVY